MLVEQVYVFWWSIITGAVLGILFDFFRAFRFKGIRDIWVYIQDIIFWLITAVIIVVSAFFINEGELRGYMLMGYLLGAGFYFLLFSKFILSALKFVFESVRKGCQVIKRNIKKIIKMPKKNKIMKVKQEN